MVNKNATIKKQLIAACLLMVFLFISITKLLHSHETDGVINVSSQIEQVSKGSDCVICDYHFTKDSDLRSVGFSIEKHEAPCMSPVLYQSRTISSIGLNYSDRGPPALS